MDNERTIIYKFLKNNNMVISDYFDLGVRQSQLKFVDINLSNDNRLFVDPKLIEISDDPIIKRMNYVLGIYWTEILKNIKNQNKTKELTSGLTEPNETKLGYSIGKIKGNSVGNVLCDKMLNEISNSIVVSTNTLSNFSQMDLIVEDIGADRVSDITTKIIKGELIKFTQEQCLIYDIPMEMCPQKDIFDYNNKIWETKFVKLPHFDGKPIIFIPKEIVNNGSSPSNLGAFYRFAINNYVLNDANKLKDIKGSGKKGKILKKDIKEKFPITKGLVNNWTIEYPKLIVDFKSNIRSLIRPLTDFELEEITNPGYKKTA